MEVNNQHIDSPNNESSPEDFKIYDDIADLPLHENPTYLNEGINGICTGPNCWYIVVLLPPFLQ